MSKKLPEGWKVEKLIDICELIRGTEPGSGSYTGNQENIRFLRIADISKSNDKRIYTNSSKVVRVLEQDLLISLDGTPGIVVDGMSGAISSGIRKIVINNEKKLSKAYLKYYLRSESVQRVIKKYSTGATILHASKSLPYIEVKFPPLEEQERIVSILERSESAIQKRKESNMWIDELVKSKFIEMFGDINRNEKGWEQGSLKDYADILTGYTFKSDKYTTDINQIKICGGLIIMPQGIEWDKCNFWNKNDIEGLEKYFLNANDIVLAMDRPWISKGLKIAMIKQQELPALLIQRTARIRGEGINQYFLYFLLKSENFKFHCKPTETTVPHIAIGDIKNYSIPLPPIKLQNQFADFVKQVDKLKFEMESSLKELENNFNSLMQKAFKGELF